MRGKKAIAGIGLICAALAWMACPGNSFGATVRFAIIGDRTGGHVPGIYGQIVDEIQRLRPEFIMTVGDMIEGYTDDTARLNTEWFEYKNLIESLTMPIYFTPGNHDILSDIQENVYREQIGDPYYSFDENGCHFIILDNGRWERGEELPEKQLNWLIDDLIRNSTARTTLVFMHKPFWYNGIAADRPDTLHNIFVTYGVDAVFTGHFHSYFSGEYDGVIYTSIGSSGGGAEIGPSGMLYHFCWVTVAGDDISVAPIPINAVKSWDVATADKLRLVTRIRQFACDFEPLFIGKDLRPIDGRIALTVRNYCLEANARDTLRWDVPDGWTVTPATVPVDISPGRSQRYEFKVDCDGALYPVPTVAINLPYSENEKTDVVRSLAAARLVSCFDAPEAPEIDGAIDDAAWHDPVEIFFSPDGSKSTVDPTEFYFAHDSSHLYIAARCAELEMTSMSATVIERDGPIYGDDCIGLFLQPDRERPVAYQIYFNPLGYAFDQRLVMNEDGYMDADRAWNGNYRVMTSEGEDFWIIEAAIPLAQFGVPGNSGDKWGINFRRKQKRLDSAADWQVPIDYNPKSFGIMYME